jgi:hypothetical protein
MSLLFDRTNYDESVTAEEIEVIDTFFDGLMMDSLTIDTTDPAVTEVNLDKLNYGTLMNIART